ncbi:transcription factor A, mitochondrial [Bombus pascuorum]|uniref:transcription factor A, mitochondrial n=1 Tax=Bombus pascuorum TaxID=65598 RepID=UPI0021362A37|nr:transcription factor A, mitochondrial [Bombus pascuorum]
MFLVNLYPLLKQALFTKDETIRIIVCKMVYFGRFIFFMRSENLLCTRNCLLNLYQNASKSALSQLKETILPPKPKKPEAAFFVYVRHVKSKLAEETPNIKYTEILKRASKKWAELNHTEKQYYVNVYVKNYEAYMNKLKEYNNSITDEQKKLWNKKKKEYKRNNSEIYTKRKYALLGKPKKPLNAYLCYLTSKKIEKDPNMTNQEWVKLLTTNWKKLSDTEKESYFTESAQLRIQYLKDLENWEIEMINSGHFDVVRPTILTKYKVTKEQEEK